MAYLIVFLVCVFFPGMRFRLTDLGYYLGPMFVNLIHLAELVKQKVCVCAGSAFSVRTECDKLACRVALCE